MHVLCIVLALANTRIAVTVASTPGAETAYGDNGNNLVEKIKENLRRNNEDYEEMQLSAANTSFPVMAPAVSPVLGHTYPVIKSTMAIESPKPSAMNPVAGNPNFASLGPPLYTAASQIFAPISQKGLLRTPVKPVPKRRQLGISINETEIFDDSVSSQSQETESHFRAKESSTNLKVNRIEQRNVTLLYVTDRPAPLTTKTRYTTQDSGDNDTYFRATKLFGTYTKSRAAAGLQIPLGVPTIFPRPSHMHVGKRHSKPQILRGYMDLNKKPYSKASTTGTTATYPTVETTTPLRVLSASVSRASYSAMMMQRSSRPLGLERGKPYTPSQSAATPMTKWTPMKTPKYDGRELLRQAILGKTTHRVLNPGQLDMAPAKGGRVAAMRLKGRLCQRHVLRPEGPKYDERGGIHVPAFKPTRGVPEYESTRSRKFLLPRCCNCCKKSVLGCE